MCNDRNELKSGLYFIALYSNAFNTFTAMNVLWLASWYPNRTNPFNGDFIERHAKAVAPFVNRLTVIAAAKDETLAYGASEIVCTKQDNITTYIIYPETIVACWRNFYTI